jgi:hypothetical protein
MSSKQLREDYDELLVKHNELVEKYDEVVVLNKSLESCNKKLKLDYASLNSKYQELEFAFDAIDDDLEMIKIKNIKENASTSCENHMEASKSFTHHDVPSSSKTNHDREKELEEELQSLTKCMYNVTRGEYLHKEILFNNTRHFGTKGLRSFSKLPENCPRSPELKDCFNKEVGSYCQHCQDVGHHTRECPIPTHPLPILPPNYKSQFNNHHFLLSKPKSGKVNAKFIGTQEKKNLPRQIWVPKALVTHIKGHKVAWVPKPQE